MGYNLETIWEQTLTIIKNDLADIDQLPLFDAFFTNSKLVDLNNTVATITVEEDLHKLILNQDVNNKLLSNSLSAVLNQPISVRILLTKEFYVSDIIDNSCNIIFKNTIEPQYTFENFVMGDSNRAAYQAAVACAAAPGQQIYNPLFIYGISGVGKTHLLHSIGNYINTHSPDKKILYINSHELVNKVSETIKNKSIDEFKSILNSVDVLMVDDIQFLSGKDKTNEIFFGIYNELYNNHKQIVLASDRLPRDIEDIEARLVSRFSQGLSVCILQPEYETYCTIVRNKLKESQLLSIVDEDVISFIATNFCDDVRTIQGAINQLIFYAITLYKSDHIDIKVANEAFRDKKINNNESTIDIKDILNAVCRYYGLTKYQLTGKTRTKNIADPRHIAIYLCRKYLDLSYYKIGEEFGGRDHSTIVSSCEKIEELISKKDSYRKAVSEIEQLLFN